MSVNPFTADPGFRDRITALESSVSAAVRAEVSGILGRTRRDVARNLGGVVPAADADAIRARHGLGVEELMLLARPLAEPFADPPVSHFHVGAVGCEATTGNLVFGGNLEFPHAHIWNTVHGEGFVTTRAFSRGATLSLIALGEAHPCAHCRQYLSEFAQGASLTLIDPFGHRLTLAALYPWPFDPVYLGETGAVPTLTAWPDLTLPASEIGTILTDAVQHAHAPYSKSPAAVALTLRDGNHVTGVTIESVAFNPTMSPLQAALIDLRAHAYVYSDIARADIGVAESGPIDYTKGTTALLEAIAPGVPLTVHRWR